MKNAADAAHGKPGGPGSATPDAVARGVASFLSSQTLIP